MKIEVLTSDERGSFTVLFGKDLIVGIKLSHRAVFFQFGMSLHRFYSTSFFYLHWEEKNHWEALPAHHQNRISEKWCINDLPELILYALPEINCKLLVFIEN